MQAAPLSERLERFARTRDPGVLWPGLTESARIAAGAEIERITREVLSGRRDVQIDAQERHAVYALAVAGHTTGMGPVVGRWIADGAVAASPTVREAFENHLRHARARASRIEREVLPALDALLASGMKPVVLKGFHTSHAYFEEPGMRRMSDVDLLIPPARVLDAETALLSAGFRPHSEALRPYKRDWIGATVEDRIHSIEVSDERSRWTLELHASLDRSFHPGAVARLDALRDLATPFAVAGREMLALDSSALLLVLACHCSQELDSTRLLRLLELVRIVRGEPKSRVRVDWQAVSASLEVTRAARYAFPALALAEDLAPGTIDSRVLETAARDSTWAARHTVARLVPAGGSLDQRGFLRQLMWTRGTLAILQRALRNLWPASFTRPGDVLPGWRVRLRRLRDGLLSFRAPDERTR